MKRITAIVTGRIQDVGYRARVVAIAKEFGLKGNIQNLEDGRVWITAEGEEGDLKEFLDAIRIKNTLIDVEDVGVEYSGATGEYANFYKLVEGGETDGKLDKASEYLKELIVAVKGGFENLGSKMDIMIDKQDMMIEKQDIMIDKQDMMIDKQDIMIDKQDIMIDKQDMMIEKQDIMIDKQDIMIDKQDMMIEKQDQTIEEMRTGFGGMKDEMRTGFESLSSKQDQTIDEIRALRGDLKSYIEWRTEKLKSELKEEIRTEFDERIRALKAHELCADVTG